jgi:hypothetical protein
MIPRYLPGAVVALIVLAGCGVAPAASSQPTATAAADWLNQGPHDIVPIVVSGDLAVGPNRFLLTVVDQSNQPLAAADRTAKLDFYDLAGDAGAPSASATGTFMTAMASLPGLYRAQVTFDQAGQWGVQLTLTDADGSQRVGRLSFPVRQTSSTPAIGSPAPATDNPTATTLDQIHQISTDTNPDPAFYELTVKQALAAHKPFLVIFATPAFCQSQTCGPALDVVKSVAKDYEDRITFIHVEPYVLKLVDGQLQPVFDASNNLTPIPAVLTWGLTTEPFTFTVNAAGNVTAKFEGIAAPDELRQALDALAP